jgi:threonine dehydratase
MFSDYLATDVLAAADRIAPHVHRTRLIRSPGLSRLAGSDILLKLENEQITGSFKVRGAMNVLATLSDDERARGVVASSAGNHGLGVAFAARHHGVCATIFIPSDAPRVKRDGIAALGARVDESQPHYDAAMVAAKAYAREHGSTYINPCLGAMLLAGQGTVALEILAERPGLHALVLSVGGGGLLGGCASLVRAVAPSVRMIGVQSVRTAAMARSLDAGHVVDIGNDATLADGLAGAIDDEALDIGRHGVDQMITVEEADIARAIVWLHDEHQLTVEGSGAVGVAAVLSGQVRPAEGPTAIVVTGSNIDPSRLATLQAAAHGA